jgi:hypothetical protein
MSENTVVTVGGAYKESDEHVPDPTDQFGTLDTSATAGSAHGQVDAVTPIFDVAKAQDKLTAAKALDPNDDSVDASLVVLPQGMVIAEDGAQAARDRVTNAAQNLDPVEIGGPNAYQQKAAESGEEAGAEAQAEQANQSGSAGTGADTNDTARQTNETPKNAPKVSGGKAGSAGGSAG